MKKIGLLAITLLFSPLAALAAIQAESSISNVTVYPDSARITRTAKIPLPAGENRILIAGLPLQLDETSLRVSGTSSDSVALGSVQLEQAIAADVVQEREKQLRTDIDDWKRKRQETADAKARAEQQLEFIRAAGGLGKAPVEGEPASSAAPKPLPMEQWAQAWQTLEAATAAAQAKARETDKTLAEFDKGIAQLEAQLAQVATGNTTTRTATLTVNAAKPTELTLALRYQIGNASWMPVYDAELNSADGKLNLKTQAEIRQATGESWTNVPVTLSTLRPTSNAALPELESTVVDFEPEVLAEAKAMPAVMARGEYNGPVAMDGAVADKMAAYETAGAAPPAAPAPAPVAMVETSSALTSGNFNAEYQIPGAITLASGTDSRRVTLESRPLESTLTLSSVPRLDPRAVITTKAPYTGEAPLIPGPVSLYRDGSFVGKTDLPQLQKGEELKLSFGEDDRVKIKVNALPDKTTEQGLLSTRVNLERSYEITLENHHDDARTIVLTDNLPVSANEDIRVTLNGKKPDQQDVDGKKGVGKWEQALAKGEKVTLKYGYTVSYPKGKKLSGL